MGGYVRPVPPATRRLLPFRARSGDDLGHRDAEETVEAAVRGARLGLARTDRDRKRFGVALHVDFAAREGDWAAYAAGRH